MNAADVAQFWLAGGKDALETAQTLMAAKKYHHALFFCHLAFEKLLKSKFVKNTNAVPPPLHNLLQLAEKAGLVLTQPQKENLREINRFNIEARYDDYKLKFYKKATPEFANRWFTITKELFSLWEK